MNFNVGDRVLSSLEAPKMMGTITLVRSSAVYPYDVRLDNGADYLHTEDELELVESVPDEIAAFFS